MAPKKKKVRKDKFRCDEVEGERFHAQTDDVFRYNWWEVFCFPYILCARFWDCCVSLCAGTNQCLVYWMMIQWVVCKITRLTTPDPIIFPYYFYMFCQVILLTTFFALLWVWFGKSVVIPFFQAFADAFSDEPSAPPRRNKTRVYYRKYCFKKGEIFDTPIDGSSLPLPSYPTTIIGFIIEVFIYDVLY